MTDTADTMEWLKQRVHQKQHFTARWLAQCSELCGMEVELLAKVIVGTFAVILAFSEQAHFPANALLVLIPFLLIFVFPAEKPSDDSLFVYFTAFGALTCFDRVAERVPAYYLIKMLVLLALFVPPYAFHREILQAIKERVKACESNKTAPPPPTPSSQSVSTARPAPSTNTALPISTPREISKRQAPLQRPSQQRLQEKVPDDPASESPPPVQAVPAMSATDISGGPGRMKNGPNPMQSHNYPQLAPPGETDGLTYVAGGGTLSPANNHKDMLFYPGDKMVFNAPFDYDNLTYHMKVTNNSHHRIAYAIKGNAVPRIMANPAFGILAPREERLIAVSVKKFRWNEYDYQRDRIAFDYCLLSDENKTETFSLGIFDSSDARLRKNIRIEYNF